MTDCALGKRTKTENAPALHWFLQQVYSIGFCSICSVHIPIDPPPKPLPPHTFRFICKQIHAFKSEEHPHVLMIVQGLCAKRINLDTHT